MYNHMQIDVKHTSNMCLSKLYKWSSKLTFRFDGLEHFPMPSYPMAYREPLQFFRPGVAESSASKTRAGNASLALSAVESACLGHGICHWLR